VAQSLFQMATSGKNVVAAIFWLKCRGGWREKSQVEHTGLPHITVLTGVPRAEETGGEWLGRDDAVGRIGGAAGPPEDETDD
jgi:hypothetical protein